MKVSFLGSKTLPLCPKCGKPGMCVDDPLVYGAKVVIHSGTRDKGIFTARKRCLISASEASK